MDLVIMPSKRYNTTPITSSQIIADLTELSHNIILKYIQQEEFHHYAKYNFTISEIHELASQPYTPLTEHQAMQIFQRLRRTATIKDAETELSRQFYKAKCDLNERRQQRTKCIFTRHECIKLCKKTGSALMVSAQTWPIKSTLTPELMETTLSFLAMFMGLFT